MDILAFLSIQNWGAVPDWFVAGGTIGAVVTALWLGQRDRRRLEQERKEAAEDREMFRAQQSAAMEAQNRKLASRVTLVVEQIRDSGSNPHIRWSVHNGGTEPISMVSVVRRAVSADGTEGDHPVVICKTWTSIEAGGNRVEVTRIYDDRTMREGELQFRDGAGQRWQRMEFGSLRRMDPGDPQSLGIVLIQR